MKSYPSELTVTAQSAEHAAALADLANDPKYVYVPVEFPKAVGGMLVESAEHEAKLKAAGVLPVEKDAEPAESSASALDGTVPDVYDTVSTMTDVDALKGLRKQEVKGKNRQGVLDAIDDRLAVLKEKK
ncbi:MAG TPA: hypothetical protein VK504_06100 [Vicinamibacterales bacterium]|nr:hypothetical protein [Vicinamibacterales bacterium]